MFTTFVDVYVVVFVNAVVSVVIVSVVVVITNSLRFIKNFGTQ